MPVCREGLLLQGRTHRENQMSRCRRLVVRAAQLPGPLLGANNMAQNSTPRRQSMMRLLLRTLQQAHIEGLVSLASLVGTLHFVFSGIRWHEWHGWPCCAMSGALLVGSTGLQTWLSLHNLLHTR